MLNFKFKRNSESRIIVFIQVFLLCGSLIRLQYIQGVYVVKAVKFCKLLWVFGGCLI